MEVFRSLPAFPRHIDRWSKEEAPAVIGRGQCRNYTRKVALGDAKTTRHFDFDATVFKRKITGSSGLLVLYNEV